MSMKRFRNQQGLNRRRGNFGQVRRLHAGIPSKKKGGKKRQRDRLITQLLITSGAIGRRD